MGSEPKARGVERQPPVSGDFRGGFKLRICALTTEPALDESGAAVLGHDKFVEGALSPKSFMAVIVK